MRFITNTSESQEWNTVKRTFIMKERYRLMLLFFFVCLLDRLWMYQRSYANFSCAKIYFNWHNHTALTLFMYFAFKESLNLELPFWKFSLNKMSCAFIAFLNYHIVPDTYVWEITSYLQCANHFFIVVCSTVTDSNCYYLDLQCNPQFDIDGSGLKSATTNKVSKFTVQTYDTNNKPTSFQQHVSAELKSLVTDDPVIQATVVSQTPSMYELFYTPTTRGCHQLTVQAM